MRELWQTEDPAVQALVGRLAIACGRSIPQTPWVDQLAPDGEPAPLDDATRREALAALGIVASVAVAASWAPPELVPAVASPLTKPSRAHETPVLDLYPAKEVASPLPAPSRAHRRPSKETAAEKAEPDDGEEEVARSEKKPARAAVEKTEEKRGPRKAATKPRKNQSQGVFPWVLVSGVALVVVVGGILAATGSFSKQPAGRRVENAGPEGVPGTNPGPSSAAPATPAPPPLAEGIAAPVPSVAPPPERVGVFASSPTKLALSRDGNILATYGDGVIKVWDLSGDAPGVAVEEPHPSEHLAVSPDGRLVASFGEKVLRVWDARTGKLTVKKNLDRGGEVDFSSDGRFVLCIIVNRPVFVVEVTSGAVSQISPEPGLFINAAACSPTTAIVVVNSGAVKGKSLVQSLAVHHLNGGRRERGVEPSDAVCAVAYSGSGEIFAARSHTKLYLWKVSDWTQTAVLPSSGSPSEKIRIGPGAKYVAGLDQSRVIVWNVSAGTFLHLDVKDCTDLAFHPRGGLLVARKGSPLTVFDPTSGAERPELAASVVAGGPSDPVPPRSAVKLEVRAGWEYTLPADFKLPQPAVTCSADSGLAVVLFRGVTLAIDAATGKPVLGAPKIVATSSTLRPLADGRFAATPERDGDTFPVVDFLTGRQTIVVGIAMPKDAVCSRFVSPDLRYVAVGKSYPGKGPHPFKLAGAGRKPLIAFDWMPGSVYFTTDSTRVLVAESSGRSQWFKLPSGERESEWSLEVAKGSPVGSLLPFAASADGSVLLYRGQLEGRPGTCHVIDGRTGRVTRSLGAYGALWGAMSADGSLAVLPKRRADGKFQRADVVRLATGEVAAELSAPPDSVYIGMGILPNGSGAVAIAETEGRPSKLVRYDFTAGVTVVKPPDPLPLPKVEKHPVPPDDELKTVRARFRTDFKAEYEKLTPSSAASLAAKLLAVAEDEKPGSANRYALLTEVMQLSERSGSLGGVIDSALMIGRDYNAPDLRDMLTATLTQMLASKYKAEEFDKVAAAELERPTTPDARITLGKDWLAVNKNCRVDLRHLVARRARLLLLDGLASPEVKGLDRIEAGKSVQEAVGEIEAADAKAGKFTLYSGKWVIKYDSKFTTEYVITDDGSLSRGRSVNPEGKEFVDKDQLKAKLVRRDGEVVVSFAQGRILERFEIRADTLVVDRFDPAKLYPKTPSAKAEGVRTGVK